MRSPMENDTFVEGLESMNRDLDKAVDDDDANYRLGAETAIGVTMSFSAGFVSWVLRTGSMMASFMSVVPLWKQIDPLPILGAAVVKNRKEHVKLELSADEKEDERVDELFNQKDFD